MGWPNWFSKETQEKNPLMESTSESTSESVVINLSQGGVETSESSKGKSLSDTLKLPLHHIPKKILLDLPIDKLTELSYLLAAGSLLATNKDVRF